MRDRSRTDLAQRLSGLRTAVDALTAVDVGEPEALTAARAVLNSAAERRELSTEHTVVALAGATGSGKSSLFNALAGFDAATVGARRPTTAFPLAVVWGSHDLPAAGAAPLLQWLEVESRHETQNPASLAGLVLLDLPDIDSINPDHRRRAERLAKTVDVLVWVLDPQKYADAVVHADFLRPMARHADVTVVVLNQIDRLDPADRPAVVKDLKARLLDDGLSGVRVYQTSARTGEGVPQVHGVLAEFVNDRRTSDLRLAADVITAATDLEREFPAPATGALPAPVQRRLLASLTAAAGAEQVAAAVGGSYRQRVRAETGWPLVRWVGRFRADPLRRLGLTTTAKGSPQTTASSLPPASPVQRAQVQTALRDCGDAAAGDCGEPWRSYVRDGAVSKSNELPDALDRAIVGTPLDPNPRPVWFRLIGALQWLVFACFIAGALWWGVYAVLAYLRIEATWMPQVGPVPASPPVPELPAIPWPTVLVVGGAVLGIVVSLIAAIIGRIGAGARTRKVRAALRSAIARTAQSVVVAELNQRRAVVGGFADGVDRARR